MLVFFPTFAHLKTIPNKNTRIKMATLSTGIEIGGYTVQSLIKENIYTESYRIEDADGNPYFLKLFIIKRLPEKMLNTSSGEVLEIEHCRLMKHKNIISYISSGIYDSVEEGTCQYYITAYFHGELLTEKIQREGKIDTGTALRIFREMLEGLKFMHNLELNHNDITPRNIMLPANGPAEVIDLGHVSGRCNGKVPFDTSDLELPYCANETFIGIYDEQSDIFAASMVLYVMLTGKKPWQTEIPENIKRSTAAIKLKDFRKAHPIDFDSLDVDIRIKIVLAKGLALSYHERYKNIDALLCDLDGNSADKAQEDPSTPHSKAASSDTPESSQGRQREQGPNYVEFDIRKGNGNGFKDIAGMQELKDYLTKHVLFVIKNKEKVAKYRLSAPNGMLLYGPPGCGKTFVAEKFAEETGFNFVIVKASDLASSFVHGSQEKIAQLFKQATEKAPIVVCFDEFDALVPDRSNYAAQYSAGEVNEFLSQLNNCSERGIFVIGTSNRPDKIDPAVLRTGRIDKQVYVPIPDKEARREMFLIHLKDRPFDENKINADRLAEMSEGYIASDIAFVVNDAAMIAAYTDQDITQELLETSLKNTHPSLRPDTIKMYDEIRQKMESTERSNLTRRKVGYV